jgi:hypothetical protein
MTQMMGGGRGMVRVIAGGCQQGVEASVVKTLEGVLAAVGVQEDVGWAVDVQVVGGHATHQQCLGSVASMEWLKPPLPDALAAPTVVPMSPG